MLLIEVIRITRRLWMVFLLDGCIFELLRLTRLGWMSSERTVSILSEFSWNNSAYSYLTKKCDPHSFYIGLVYSVISILFYCCPSRYS